MKVSNRLAATVCIISLGGCHRNRVFTPPTFEDAPVLESVSTTDLPEVAPGFGIAGFNGGGTYEINIESDDGAKIRVGQKAFLSSKPEAKTIAAHVTRVIRAVSAETGQALVSLKADSEAHTPPGEFIFATITIGSKSHVLTVNSGAILVRDGKTWVIKATEDQGEKNQLVAQEVTTGISDQERVEIVSGLRAGDRVVKSGGLGALYPDFKSQVEGD